MSPFDSKQKLIDTSFPPVVPPSQKKAGSHSSALAVGCPPLGQQAHGLLHHQSEIPSCYHVLEVLQRGGASTFSLQGIERYVQVMPARHK